jgi:hypothetical protein
MSTSEVEALQSEKKVKDIDQQIKEEEVKGDKADKSKLEDLKAQKQETSAIGARATTIAQAQFKDDGVTGADVAKNFTTAGLPALMDLFSSAPSLEQRAQGETTYSETAGKYIDKLFGGSLGIEKEIEKDREAAQAQLDELKKKLDDQKKFATGGYTGDGGKDEIAGLVHKGEYVINQDQTKKYKPLLEKINNGEPLLDTINDKGAALDKQILNASQNENKTSNIDIANNLATLIDKISNTLPTLISSYKPDTTLPPENSIRPSTTELETELMTGTKTQPSTSNTNITVDMSQVTAAVDALTESIRKSSGTEMVFTIDGTKIAKVTAPILPNEFTKTSVAT